MTVEEEFTGNPAVIEPDGTVKISPLTDEVLQRVPNPMGYPPARGASLGLRVIYQGVEQYSLVAMTGGGNLSTHTNSATGDFGGWLADKVDLERSMDVASGMRASGRDTGAVRGGGNGWMPDAPGARRSWQQSYRCLLRAQPDPERSGGARPNHQFPIS